MSRSRTLVLVVSLLTFAPFAEAQILGDLNCLSDMTRCPVMFSYIYSFSNSTGANGFTPMSALTLGDDGNFYGTTMWGGLVDQNSGLGYGTVFRMSPSGAITTLWAFTNGSDGAEPATPLTKGPDGSMWGITGLPASVFKIAPDGTFTSFGPMPYWIGTSPNSLTFGSDGNLYATSLNGSGDGFTGAGVFYQFTTDGVATLLYIFDGKNGNGAGPSALVLGQDGYFYGTTAGGGGPGGTGTFFRMTPSGHLTTLYVFPNSGVVYSSGLPLVAGVDGYFYGTSNTRVEAVFQLDTSGNLNMLANLSNSYLSGQTSPLVQGSDGNLYGATGGGVYSISPAGAFTTLYPLNGSFINKTLQGATGVPQLTFGPGGLYGVFPTGGPGCQNTSSPICTPALGGAVFQLSTATGGSHGSGAPGPALTSKLDAIDPNNNTLLPFLPLPSLGIEWDNSFYPAFANYPASVTALAADGVTPLVIRWRFSQPVDHVTFTLSDSACAGSGPQTCENTGVFVCLDAFDCDLDPNNLLSITVTAHPLPDGSYMAFAMMQAPMDFVRPSMMDTDSAARNRTINITATIPSAAGPPILQNTLPLTLWRPPVALLHGVWSSACTWKLGMPGDPLSQFIVYAEDYELTNSFHFAVNALEPQRAIKGALAKMHALNIAATQVDFVGHSMGGLLGRQYAANVFPALPYLRPENLGLGDMHKFITLDTPHLGSSLANALVDSDNNETLFGQAFATGVAALDPGPACSPYHKASDLPPLMCITCGAVQDLSQGSAALTGMPALMVPSHVIVGRGGIAALADSADFAGAMDAAGGPAAGLAAGLAGLALQFNFFGTDNHDLIVSETSQIGNMFVKNQVTDLDPQVPTTWAVHTTVTGEMQTRTVLVNLLNAPLNNSDTFGALPSTP